MEHTQLKIDANDGWVFRHSRTKNVVHLERAISKTMYYPHKILIAQRLFETHNFELEFSLKPIQI